MTQEQIFAQQRDEYHLIQNLALHHLAPIHRAERVDEGDAAFVELQWNHPQHTERFPIERRLGSEDAFENWDVKPNEALQKMLVLRNEELISPASTDW